LATSESATLGQMESVLTALGCIAEVLPEKAAGQMRSVVASVVVKQVRSRILSFHRQVNRRVGALLGLFPLLSSVNTGTR